VRFAAIVASVVLAGVLLTADLRGWASPILPVAPGGAAFGCRLDCHLFLVIHSMKVKGEHT
jgi:hypothetical protein